MADVGWYSSSFFLAQVAFQNPLGKAYYVFGFKQVFVGAILFFQIGCIGAAIYLFFPDSPLHACTPAHLLARSLDTLQSVSKQLWDIAGQASPALPCPPTSGPIVPHTNPNLCAGCPYTISPASVETG
ncbi:hypothetical protein S40285_07803 [Stachybotrys chlorohalonatus IBT 40285]|uniref:Uncharacterized protein n=1 Tax=Stachybotrys chlorohalonatus (strain IBT 40285) TaxID=1283841 RepID=A0A084R2G3_STAC4|nr:hypothetical protein S40285_07803 [Stachybotrys chlorohalonata IBT 40285]